MARELGVGVGTIVTYRRRGYEKLCVQIRQSFENALSIA